MRGVHRSHGRLLAGALALAALLVAAPVPRFAGAAGMGSGGSTGRLAAGDHVESLTVDHVARRFILHVPPGRAVAERPLVLVFHGATDTAESTIASTDFEAAANRAGEVVDFLQGVDDRWNEWAGKFGSTGVNDVAYTAAVVAKTERLLGFDHGRIVAVGFSNGALMVESLGCQMAGTLALIVPVEGELATPMSPKCAPVRPIHVYEVHGTADTAIRYNGGHIHGPYGTSTFTVLSAPASVKRWAQLDHCGAQAKDTYPSSGIKLTTYTGCHQHAWVVLRTIDGGVHEWGAKIGQIVAGVIPK